MISVARMSTVTAMTPMPSVSPVAHRRVVHRTVARVIVVVRRVVSVVVRHLVVRVIMRPLRTRRRPLIEDLTRRWQPSRNGGEALRVAVETRTTSTTAQPIALTVEVTVETRRLGFALYNHVAGHHGADGEVFLGSAQCSVRRVVMIVRHLSSIPVGGYGTQYTPRGYSREVLPRERVVDSRRSTGRSDVKRPAA